MLRRQIKPVMQWKQVSSTAIDSLVLDDFKTFIHRPLEDDFWDAETTGFISAAQKAIEKHCDLTIVPAEWIGYLPFFSDSIEIVRRPFREVTKIEYVDEEGQIQTLPTDRYQVSDAGMMTGMILRGEDYDWPNTARRRDAVRIYVKSGFYDLEGEVTIPPEIKQALFMTVAEIDQNRGDVMGNSQAGSTVYAMKNSRHAFLSEITQNLLVPFKYMEISLI